MTGGPGGADGPEDVGVLVKRARRAGVCGGVAMAEYSGRDDAGKLARGDGLL